MRRFVTAVAAVIVLSGCGKATQDDGQSARAQALWDARTDFVGDNSRVAALVSRAGLAPEGKYTLSLETHSTPYGLRITLVNPGKPCPVISSERSEQLLLGLIANLDRVTVTCEAKEHTTTAAEATEKLGFDVKALGRNKDRLSAYLESYE